MNGKIINNLRKEPVILVAPLDWGLGHATRCIPIINTLLRNGARVILAGEAATEQLYRKEFPTLHFLPLKGYRVTYARKKQHFNLKLLSQFPRLQRIIVYEHRWLKKVVAEHHIDAVISDNRPGLYHPHIPCVYITHQLFIESGSNWLSAIAQRMHYHFINRFMECWVPDVAGSNNLAGKLSHPQKLPVVPLHYLGCLSRFTQGAKDKSTRLLVLLSGPEPMRSIFEKLICEQLKGVKGDIVLVRGLPLETSTLAVPANVTVHNHLPAAALQECIQSAEMILARGGYSTIMDLARLQQKAVLVPTPGQGEQEYLAKHLMKNKLFYACAQNGFNLVQELNNAQKFYATAATIDSTMKETPIRNWLERIVQAKALQ